MNITKVFGLILSVFTITILVYVNHWQNSFHFDDAHTIENNLYIRNLKNIPCFFGLHTSDCQVPAAATFSSIPSHGSYRPLVSTTLAIDYAMGNGYIPFWFHFSTFFFFLFQLLMMVFFFRRLLQSLVNESEPWILSCLITLGYAIHPVNAETVNYMIARSDSLSTAFVFAGLVIYQYFPSLRKSGLFIVPVILGCFAKPTAVMFVPLLGVYHLLFDQEVSLLSPGSWSLKKLFLTLLVPGVVCAAMYFFIQKMESGYFVAGGVDRTGYWLTQPRVWMHYVMQCILPLQLSADTDWGVFTTPLPFQAWVGMGYVLLMIGAAFLFSLKKELRPISFGLIWFMLCLLPTSVVPLAEVMNDHRLFFPFSGLILVFGWGLYLVYARLHSPWKKGILLVAVILISGYGFGTLQRNQVWKTEESLWKDVTEKSPRNGRGWMNYGLTQMGKGNYVEAERCFREGLEYCPRYAYLHVNMGIVRAAQGDITDAEAFFRRGLSYADGSPNPYYYYARFLYEQGRKNEAIYSLEQAYRISPAHQFTTDLLLQIYFETGNGKACRELAESTLRVDPQQPVALRYLGLLESGKDFLDIRAEETALANTAEAWLQLSLEYYLNGRYELCVNAARHALTLRPDFAEAWNNICSGYNALNRYREAAAACREALKINPSFERAKNNLKWADQQIQSGK